MKSKQFLKKIGLLLVLVIILTAVLSACGKKEEISSEPSKTVKETESVPDQTEKESEAETVTGQEDEPEDIDPEEVDLTDAVSGELTVEKIGSTDLKNVSLSSYSFSSVYKSNGKYGFITADGKTDSGAVYAYCDGEDYGFVVFSETISPDNAGPSVEEMNAFGLLDVDGSVLIPAEYAVIRILNSRYVEAIYVDGVTENENDAVTFISNSDSLISLFPSEGDTLLKGGWVIFDTMTGKTVPGVSGNKNTSIDAYGPYIKYYDADGKYRTVDYKGQDVSEDVTGLGGDLCAAETDSKGTVYHSRGAVVFTYDREDYSVYSYNGDGTFSARKSDDYDSYYFVVDGNGDPLSADFDDYFSKYGELILIDDKVVDLEGNTVLDEPVADIYFDDLAKELWLAETEDEEYILFEKDGNVLWRGRDVDEYDVDYYDFIISVSDETEDSYHLYAFSPADKGFTVEYSWGFNLVEQDLIVCTEDDDGTYSLVDLRSNNVLIKGYAGYQMSSHYLSGVYVFAAKAGGGYDVYLMK